MKLYSGCHVFVILPCWLAHVGATYSQLSAVALCVVEMQIADGDRLCQALVSLQYLISLVAGIRRLETKAGVGSPAKKVPASKVVLEAPQEAKDVPEPDAPEIPIADVSCGTINCGALTREGLVYLWGFDFDRDEPKLLTDLRDEDVVINTLSLGSGTLLMST